MAKLSSDKTYVTVQSGDTLSQIAADYAGGYNNYKKLAAINGISNPNLIYVGQKIYLQKSGGSSSKSTSSNMALIKQFGLQADVEKTLFATWVWDKSNTENYQVEWQYYTKDRYWFVGEDSTTKYKYSTFSIPSNAIKVRFRVKPIAKNETVKKKNGSTYERAYWKAEWTDRSKQVFNVNAVPPTKPSIPSVEIDGTKLTAKLENINSDTTSIKFQIIRDNEPKVYKTGTATVKTAYASYSCTIAVGSEYKVRCQALRGDLKSEWSEYSSNAGTAPSTLKEIIALKALSETSVQLDWTNVTNATSYTVEYTTKKMYFDSSNEVSSITVDAKAAGHAEITGLTSGEEYFFRVKASNSNGDSGWCPIKSIVIGKKPSAPTTWSSTTTVIAGESLNLYWVHNSEDGSSQTYAELEMDIGGTVTTKTIKNTADEEEKDKTSVYAVATSTYTEGTQIKWRVRTAGITKVYGDWSIQRVVDIYSAPSLELSLFKVIESTNTPIETLDSFPFYISALAAPNTQAPTGYYLVITANELYDTVDNMGDPVTINKDEAVYSKYFDTSDPLMVEMSAGNVSLENGISYTVTCTASMNSGLTAESSEEFTVSWSDDQYVPNAEIGIDTDVFSASIRPYCEEKTITIHKVNYADDIYTISEETIDDVYGTEVEGAYTDGQQVYSGVDADGNSIYYCMVEKSTLVEGVSLSVYRREFDGGFTEIAKDLSNTSNIYVTDPHPALDYARYRIVAKTISTGSIGYYDIPNEPVGGKAVIIQWDEKWSSFNATDNDDPMYEPAWTGSLLRLPYNIDVSDKYGLDVELVEYIGRKHPVSYYGTQRGESSTWNVDIEKSDEETLYALRRLATYAGDVYVREPSGTGYWANVGVSFSQTHCELVIPVTLEITRVEGGI